MNKPPPPQTLSAIHDIYHGRNTSKPQNDVRYTALGHMKRDPSHSGSPPARPLPPGSRRGR